MSTAYTYHRKALEEDPTAHQARLETATTHYTDSLADRFTQGDTFTDSPESATLPMLVRPRALLLAERLQPGDAIVISDTSTAFASTQDLLVSVGKWTRDRVFVVLLDIGVCNATPDDVKAFNAIVRHMECEYRRRCERARRGVKSRKLNAPHRGGDPRYGFRWIGTGKRLREVRCDTDRRQMSRMLELRESGLSHENVAREMMLSREKNSRTGREWSRSAVDRAIRAEIELRKLETQPQKQCSACFSTHAATTENFHSNTNNDDGLHRECRACRSTKRKTASKTKRDKAAIEAFEQVSKIAERGDTLSEEDRLTIASIAKAFGGERKLAREFQKLYEQAPAGSQQKARMLFKMIEMAGI